VIGVKDAATFAYPRLRYGSITRSFREAAIAYATPETALRTVNVTPSGKAEYLLGRIEDTARVDLMCEPDELAQLRWFFRDQGGPGKQFELWLDRHTGSIWTFEDSLRDQNLLPLVFQGGTPAFVDAVNGRAVTVGVGNVMQVGLAQASATTRTVFDDPLGKAEGVIVLDVTPIWSGNDAALHVFLDTGAAWIDTQGTWAQQTGTWATQSNRLRLYKSATNQLTFEIVDDTGAAKSKAGAVSWAANARIVVIAAWDAAGNLRLWVGVPTGPSWSGTSGTWAAHPEPWGSTALTFSELVSGAGAGSGKLAALPATLYVGADNLAANGAAGAYDTLAIFKKAFPNPLLLADYRPVWRNYFPYGELLPLGPATLEALRLTPSRTIFRWPLLVRNGVP
jgi:hypothetical protein